LPVRSSSRVYRADPPRPVLYPEDHDLPFFRGKDAASARRPVSRRRMALRASVPVSPPEWGAPSFLDAHHLRAVLLCIFYEYTMPGRTFFRVIPPAYFPRSAINGIPISFFQSVKMPAICSQRIIRII